MYFIGLYTVCTCKTGLNLYPYTRYVPRCDGCGDALISNSKKRSDPGEAVYHGLSAGAGAVMFTTGPAVPFKIQSARLF